MIPYSDSSGCVNLAKGLKQLGITDTKKILSAPLCLNGLVAAGLGGDFPIWTYAIASSLFGDPTDPGMPAYMKVMAKYGTPAVAPDPWVIVTFGQILTTARFLNELGYGHITPSTVLAQGQGVHGTGGARRAGPAVRQVRDRAGHLQRQDAVLPVQGKARVRQDRGMAPASVMSEQSDT